MKSKYEKLFKARIGDKKIEIRKNKQEYILMYCKSTIKNFNKKAKRVNGNIESIIESCKELFDLNITKKQLSYSTSFMDIL
ncbi:MAG: hypothetical protein CMG66_05945 [Candidatus Marinimicrobia bacterium]|nr:hypothetical protein [Candidatus Neomarinimicrobiota bacterium]|tara:strand:+ start:18254 stop:18496 length:243 start_codon:yes stop_codon:yes gene_type:complete